MSAARRIVARIHPHGCRRCTGPALAGATGAPREASLPPYLPSGGRDMAVYSNRAWTDGDQRAREITPVTTLFTGERNTAATVWIGRCSNTTRTVRFRRSVTLLGPPAELTVRLDNGVDATYTFTVLLNGTRVLTSESSGNHSLDARARRRLTPGRNDLVVVVRRTVTPNSSCSRFNGVFFGFEGRFTMDLVAGYRPGGWPTVYARPGQELTFDVNIRNRGPARVPVAQFLSRSSMGQVMPDGQRAISLVVSGVRGDAVTGCRRTTSHDEWVIRCGVRNLDPGESATVSLTLHQRLDAVDAWDDSTLLNWSLSPFPSTALAPQDLNNANNVAIQSIILCGHGSTTPGCAAAH